MTGTGITRTNLWKKIMSQAKQLKSELHILFLALKHPKTPWYTKIFIATIIGYAFSPIDLIPDFIPVLGYLDDLVLIPAGIILARKLIPQAVLEECRKKAKANPPDKKPKNWIAGGIIILIWLYVIYFILRVGLL